MKNIGVILAAGNSSRFQSDIPKQLYKIDNKSILDYSIEVMSQCLDEVILVTNSDCVDKISNDISIIINNIDSRIESIKCALDFIGDQSGNIIIHDAARPFIKISHIQNLLNYSKEFKHCQYYLPIVNGLAKKSNIGWEIPDREDYIELCTPQCTDLDLFRYIFKDYILTGKECEILPVMSSLKKEVKLLEGSYRDLRKITTLDDIY